MFQMSPYDEQYEYCDFVMYFYPSIIII
jgi:hypothetical protein